MRALRTAAVILMVAAASLLGRASYLNAKAELAGVLIRRAWAETLRSGTPHTPWSWADTHPVARLRIARIGYDEIVLEGATPRTLAFGPAHLLSSAALGEPGNLVIAGHRTSWFRPLEKVEPGDRIEVEWVDRARSIHHEVYRIDAIRIVDPLDRRLLAPTADAELTLITCYPFGAGPRSPERFVVRAVSVRS
jgi:sortase A